MVGECVRGMVRDCQEPALLLESVGTTLSGADASDPQAAIRKVKAACIVIGCFQPVRHPKPYI